MYSTKFAIILISAIVVLFVLLSDAYDLGNSPISFESVSNIRMDLSPELYLCAVIAVISILMLFLVRYVRNLDAQCAREDRVIVNLFCPECGRQLSDSEEFCFHCGNDLSVKCGSRPTFIDRISKYEPEYAGKH